MFVVKMAWKWEANSVDLLGAWGKQGGLRCLVPWWMVIISEDARSSGFPRSTADLGYRLSLAQKTLIKMVDENDLKRDLDPTSHDVDLGQVLAVESTPEEERKVLRKLDFV